MNKPDIYINANAQQLCDSRDILNEYKNQFKINSGETVADIGCGPGNVTISVLAPILHTDTQIVGYDLSSEMISYAKKHYENEKISFKVTDIAKNNNSVLTKGSFDKVFSFFSLHWVQDQKEAISNIYSMLKEGGTMFVLFPSDSPVFSMYERLNKSPIWGPYMRDYRKTVSPYHNVKDGEEIFKNILKEVGFNVIRCTNKDKCYEFPTVEKMLDFLKAINAFIDRIPPEIREKYYEEMKNTILEDSNLEIKSNGRILFKYRLIVALAKK